MNPLEKKDGIVKSVPTVQEVIDAAIIEDLIASGMTEAQARQEVIESRQMTELYIVLMAQGYTDEQIDVLWEGKTPQEILAESNAKKSAPRNLQRRIRKPTALNKTP